MHVPSPCISVCVIGRHNVCEGCYRTIEEIASWGSMTNQEKLEILEDIPRRADEYQPDDEF